MTLDYKRAQQLFKQGLIAKADFEQRKAAFEGQKAAVAEASSRIVQARAQLAQLKAQLAASQKQDCADTRPISTASSDILKKHNVVAPIDGLVTYLAGAGG